MHPVQYLCSKNNHHGRTYSKKKKLVGTMAQDSVQKEERKTIHKKRRTDPHAIEKLKAVLKQAQVQIHVIEDEGEKPEIVFNRKGKNLYNPKLFEKKIHI